MITESDAKQLTKLVLETNPLRCAVTSNQPNAKVDKWRPGSSLDGLFESGFQLVNDRPGEWYYGHCLPNSDTAADASTCVRDGIGLVVRSHESSDGARGTGRIT